MNIAFIGLGIMGRPMAGHLKAAGHTITVVERASLTAEDRAAHAVATVTTGGSGEIFVLAVTGSITVAVDDDATADGHGGTDNGHRRCATAGEPGPDAQRPSDLGR